MDIEKMVRSEPLSIRFALGPKNVGTKCQQNIPKICDLCDVEHRKRKPKRDRQAKIDSRNDVINFSSTGLANIRIIPESSLHDSSLFSFLEVLFPRRRRYCHIVLSVGTHTARKCII